MKTLKIKIICGFRKDQQYTLDISEAHKAYYLFLHPDERGIFENGLALVGRQIQAIEPDYHATMGWNQSHILDGYDWGEIRSQGIEKKMQQALAIENVKAGEMAESLMRLSKK